MSNWSNWFNDLILLFRANISVILERLRSRNTITITRQLYYNL